MTSEQKPFAVARTFNVKAALREPCDKLKLAVTLLLIGFADAWRTLAFAKWFRQRRDIRVGVAKVRDYFSRFLKEGKHGVSDVGDAGCRAAPVVNQNITGVFCRKEVLSNPSGGLVNVEVRETAPTQRNVQTVMQERPCQALVRVELAPEVLVWGKEACDELRGGWVVYFHTVFQLVLLFRLFAIGAATRLIRIAREVCAQSAERASAKMLSFCNA